MADNIFTKPIWEYLGGGLQTYDPIKRAANFQRRQEAVPRQAPRPTDARSRFSGMRDQAVRNARNGIQWGEPPSARIQPPVAGGGANTAPAGGGDPNRTPVPRVTPRSEVQSQALGTAIQQAQGPSFWESNTALKEAAMDGPRSTDVGYSNRADIQAWMDAMNKTDSGKAMVQRFLEKERKAGRVAQAQPLTNDILPSLGDGWNSNQYDPAKLPSFQTSFDKGTQFVTPEMTRMMGQKPNFAAQAAFTEPINYADAGAFQFDPSLAQDLLKGYLNRAGGMN